MTKTASDPMKVAIDGIIDSFGEGSVQLLGSRKTVQVEAISTGAPTLDDALGIGGVPRGRIVEVYGPESSGKTTLVYHVLANAQAKGLPALFIDAEHALDPIYAKEIGVDTDNLLVHQPDYGEQALEVADRIVKAGPCVVAVDSVAALTPHAILEGEMGEQTVGLLARLMSQAMSKLAGNANRSGATVIFTNQLRTNINMVGYGPNETQPGGRALKFYASQRIDLRRIETLKHKDEAIGNRVRAKVVKNKLAAPHRIAEFEIDYGYGISKEACLLDMGLQKGVVTRSGAFYTLPSGDKVQGRANAKMILTEAPIASELEEAIRETT